MIGRLGLALLALLVLRADMYPDGSNAAKPQAQYNFGQMKSIVPQQYGAIGDGVADDTAAVQAWLDDLVTGLYLGQCSGKFRLTAGVNGYALRGYRVQGGGYGDAVQGQEFAVPGGICNFHVDFNGWDQAAIDLTRPTGAPSDTNRSRGIEWSHFIITYNPALTAPPIGFRHRYSAKLSLHDFECVQETVNLGTCVSISSVWNAYNLSNWHIVHAGGNRSAHLVPGGTTFTIAATSTTLTASAAFFAATDVGLDIVCEGTNKEVWRITGFTSSTQVTVGRPAWLTHTAQTCALSQATGSMTAASNVLTLSHPTLTADDVGRAVYVLGAGDVFLGTAIRPLRAQITAVSGTTVTLSDVAGTTVTAEPVIISPAVEVYAEARGDDHTNDMVFDKWHFEAISGTPLVIYGGSNIRGSDIKLCTGTDLGEEHKGGQFNAVFAETDIVLNRVVSECTPITTRGQILFQANSTQNTLEQLQGSMITGTPRVHLGHNNFNSTFRFGDMKSGAKVDQAWLPFAVATDGTSLRGAVFLGTVSAYSTGVTVPRASITPPTSCAGLATGALWNSAGAAAICP